MDPKADIEVNAVPSNTASWTHGAERSSGAKLSSSHTSPSPVILRISPAQDGAQFGYIHLASGEIDHQEAIRAYFDSAGREVTTLPCPDFEGFLLANTLRTRNIIFLMDLPEYILRLGRRILEDNAYSSDGYPTLSWLPPSPSVTLPSLLSGGPTRSASRPANVMTRARPPPLRPDPDGVTAPIFFSMGGLDKSGVFSPLTSSDFCPSRGGSPHRGYILTPRSSSSSTQLTSGGVSTMSSIAGSMIPTSSDSSESAPSLDLAPPTTIPTDGYQGQTI